MEILKIILTIIYFVICLGMVVITIMQSKKDEGAGGAIMGGGMSSDSSTSSFYEKNKGRTKEGKLKKWTIILAVLLALGAIGLGTIYMV